MPGVSVTTFVEAPVEVAVEAAAEVAREVERPDLAVTDRYGRMAGRVHLTGIQALARLPLDQARRDRLAGRAVGTYISGYEGSPLGGYDLELQRQAALLESHDISFQPGLNEELAATAVQGSQMISALEARVEGVVGFWYGKAPGLDRATDALRHANLAGTHPSGGAVALVGDDPAAKSSSVPCASERALADLGIPTFFPADSAEILELGRHAIEMSRASGLWTAIKVVTAVADGSSTVDLETLPETPVYPHGSHQHVPTTMLLQPVLGPLERDFLTTRMRIATEYSVANDLNPTRGASPLDRVGIVAAGKTYLDVQQALTRLGWDPERLEESPIRLLKVGLVWPLAPATIREFAEGLDEIVVVEEKRSFLEAQIREVLYDAPVRPTVSGKADPTGADLVPAYGELDPERVSTILGRRFAALDVVAPGAAREVGADRVRTQLPLVRRQAYFCSGCPHNSSTRPHIDSPVGAGIGCHTLVVLMDEKQVGSVNGMTQMGGEGTQWFGAAPFVKAGHFVQNLGDGTFHHSGSLAIRAAVAAGINVTYRLLYNGTVAMTGGQQAVGQMSLPQIVRNLQSEGVARIIVTTDDVKRIKRLGLPRSVKVVDRARIAEVARTLSETSGVTVQIHAQDCATELRRKRKRGKAETPNSRVVINERLCEGCGDCGEKSNCLSVRPVQTDLGRKTAIHQSSCNVDLTCLKGDCPAFMTVTPGSGRTAFRSREIGADELISPTHRPVGVDQQIRLIGIGGTGVVTTSQVLSTAAVLSGLNVRTLDQTGLAQKGGSVVADVKIAAEAIAAGNKIGEGDCDVLLGYDVLTVREPAHLTTLSAKATAIVSTSVVPTGAMVSDKDVLFPDVVDVLDEIAERIPEGTLLSVDANAVAEGLFGAEQFANLFLIGMAFQSGALALSAEAIEEAITLSGTAVATNIQAFRRGRQYVIAPEEVDSLLAERAQATVERPRRTAQVVLAQPGSELMRLVEDRSADLVAYQDERYAVRYEQLVEQARLAEARLGTGSTDLAEAVARYYYKLLAYKDEYEVARLALAPETTASVRAAFGANAKAAWMLHPPTLRAWGLGKKLKFGPWFGVVFRVLYALRGLRGTALDPFGRAQVRRVERDLVREYESLIADHLGRLTSDTHATLVELATLPDQVRGYEDVKLRSVEGYRRRVGELVAALDGVTEAVSVPTAHPVD